VGAAGTLQVEVKTVQDGSLPEIRRVARRIAKQHDELKSLIAANAELFIRPRTHIVDGLKFGLQKQTGTISWADDAKLCARIHKLCAEGVIPEHQAELLIQTTEKPLSKAVEKLDGTVLKRLGVEVGKDGDAVLIKSVDGEVEKAVKALIKDAAQDASAGADL
jgi:hypothetical protein